jgi:predicted nuclease with TOPRIM domain
MSTPITRHQRELSSLAIVIAQQQDTIDGLLSQFQQHDKRDREVTGALQAMTDERAELLRENERLRTELNEHVALIHRLCDARANRHNVLRITRGLLSLHQAQSDELCAKYEAEEKRANEAENGTRIARGYSQHLMNKNNAMRAELITYLTELDRLKKAKSKNAR